MLLCFLYSRRLAATSFSEFSALASVFRYFYHLMSFVFIFSFSFRASGSQYERENIKNKISFFTSPKPSRISLYFPLCHKEKKETKLLWSTKKKNNRKTLGKIRPTIFFYCSVLFFAIHYIWYLFVATASRAFLLILVNICLFADVAFEFFFLFVVLFYVCRDL